MTNLNHTKLALLILNGIAAENQSVTDLLVYCLDHWLDSENIFTFTEFNEVRCNLHMLGIITFSETGDITKGKHYFKVQKALYRAVNIYG